jgi:hypothetical protein
MVENGWISAASVSATEDGQAPPLWVCEGAPAQHRGTPDVAPIRDFGSRTSTRPALERGCLGNTWTYSCREVYALLHVYTTFAQLQNETRSHKQKSFTMYICLRRSNVDQPHRSNPQHMAVPHPLLPIVAKNDP